MNTESAECRRVKVPLAEGSECRPGDFAWSFDSEALNGERTYLYVCLPGFLDMSAIEVQRGPARGERVWGWDGNIDKPTLTPSINAAGHWHGFLRAGRLESC